MSSKLDTLIKVADSALMVYSLVGENLTNYITELTTLAVQQKYRPFIEGLLENSTYKPDRKNLQELSQVISNAPRALELYIIRFGNPKLAPNTDLETLLQLAAANGYTRLVKFLLNNTKVKSKADDNMALKIAKLEGYVDIVSLLEQ